MRYTIVYCLLILKTICINFPLSDTRQTCLYIKAKGLYEMQYIVSGEQANLYTCTIYSDQTIIENITELTEYEKQIQFKSDNNKICFSSLDNQMKQVSFDIMSIQDPLKNHFSAKDQELTHSKMYNAFQELQKVYRDQHMFIQRSTIYQNILENKQMKIMFVLLFKIFVAVVLGAYQLMLIKQIVGQKTYGYSLPPGIQDDSSESQNDQQ